MSAVAGTGLRPQPERVADVAVPTSLVVRELSVTAKAGGERLRLLDDVSLTVGAGRCTAVIGESGSGKSTLLRAILRTTGRGVGTTGEVELGGRRISDLPDRRYARLRGREIAMVAQNALAALDPMYPVGNQIAYLARRARGVDRRAARARAVELLAHVGLPDPERAARSRPHELSGGMRQRCVLAMALACGPALLLADEPTTALDVVTQARALDLLARTQRELGMGMVFVTHDIGVAATVADDVVVLYAGRVAEAGPVAEVLTHPSHPYTLGLIQAAATPGPGQRWRAIGGEPPRPQPGPRIGCPFAPRCPEVTGVCETELPPVVRLGPTSVHCHAREPAA